jgi:radical SAM superfamily enzyme YgiQ (UPF0313 family)
MPNNFKILLINPPYAHQVYTTTRDVHEAMERKPPLGILSIGTYLKKYTDFEVRLLDNQLEALKDDEVARLIQEYRPDVVGITVVSFKLYSAYRITQVVKESLPSAHLCWGGPHLSIFPKESLHLPGVDAIVLGDGEIPFRRLCQNLSEGKKIEGVQGVYTIDNEPHDSQFQDYVHTNLDELPMLDITLLPYKRYRAFLTNGLMATAITSRGCPYRCIFCKLDFNRIRLVSIENVIRLLETYIDLGIKEVEFYDETFNLNTNRVIEFANHVINKGLKFKWSFRSRVDKVNDEMLKLIKRAGCQRIQYGVEAGTDRVLEILKKEITVDQIKQCFRLTNKVKIDTVAYFILGNPGETLEEMNKTIQLAREIKPTYLEYAIFNISPGTESYKMALDEGVIWRDYWREYAASPDENMPVLVWTKDYTYGQLSEVRRKALKDFYMRPGYILNRMINIRPREAYQIIKTGIAVLKDIVQP